RALAPELVEHRLHRTSRAPHRSGTAPVGARGLPTSGDDARDFALLGRARVSEVRFWSGSRGRPARDCRPRSTCVLATSKSEIPVSFRARARSLTETKNQILIVISYRWTPQSAIIPLAPVRPNSAFLGVYALFMGISLC